MSNKASISIVLAVFLIAVCTLCCKKNCSSITCRSYGYNPTFRAVVSQVCSNGFCTCINGYEGDSCQTLSAVKFQNITYLASDYCSGLNSYTVTIQGDPNNYAHLFIYGLFGLNEVDGYITSGPNNTGNNISIPSPNGSAGAVDYYGTGTYSNVSGFAKIIFNMDFTANGIEKNCTVTLQQQ